MRALRLRDATELVTLGMFFYSLIYLVAWGSPSPLRRIFIRCFFDYANGTAFLTIAATPAEACLSCPIVRLYFTLFALSRWRLPGLRRSTLPDAVILKRFAIDFLVFCIFFWIKKVLYPIRLKFSVKKKKRFFWNFSHFGLQIKHVKFQKPYFFNIVYAPYKLANFFIIGGKRRAINMSGYLAHTQKFATQYSPPAKTFCRR